MFFNIESFLITCSEVHIDRNDQTEAFNSSFSLQYFLMPQIRWSIRMTLRKQIWKKKMERPQFRMHPRRSFSSATLEDWPSLWKCWRKRAKGDNRCGIKWPEQFTIWWVPCFSWSVLSSCCQKKTPDPLFSRDISWK